MSNEKIHDIIREEIKNGDEYIVDRRGTDNLATDQRKIQVGSVHRKAIELSEIAGVPPDFLFLHESVFMDSEIVENVNPDLIKDKPKWWEIDTSVKYLEDGADMISLPEQNTLTSEDRANELITIWKKLSETNF